MISTRFLVAAAAIALPALPASAQMIPASTYVMKAGAGDLYEKTSSQIVLQSTHNDGLRRFADQMIRDHTKSTMDVKHAAMKTHVRVGAPHLDPKQARMVAQLRAARGPNRDMLYVQQQKMAHDEALALHSGYARDGKNPALRQVASSIAPVVQSHIDMLHHM